MTFVSFAQNFEDVILWRALHEIERGQYVDIGAQDPRQDSVSLAFHQAGWLGIHVEPTPYYAARLREERPGDMVIEAVVTDAPGPFPFFEIPNTGISTGRSDVADHHSSNGFVLRKIYPATVRLDHLLKLAEGDIHWMKVDVEGMEADVLRSWGESDIRPWILAIESTFPSTQRQTQDLWIDEVLRRGYRRVLFDGLSSYFLHDAHRELASRFVAPANVFDRFSITKHHFSAGLLKNELEASQADAARAETLQKLLGAAERQRDLAERERQQAVDALLKAQEDHRGAERDLKVALAKVIAAEQNHRATVVVHMRERQALELRHQERQDSLHERLRESEALLASARVEAARAEERSAAYLSTTDGLRKQLSDVAARLAHSEASQQQMRAEVQARSEDHRSLLTAAEEGRVAAEAASAAVRGELEQLRVRFLETEALVARACAEQNSGWQRFGARLGVSRRCGALETLAAHIAGLAAPNPSSSSHQSRAAEKSMQLPTTDGRNPYLRANSLSELLAWHDVDFVRCAFVTMLGRQPDAEGEAYYAGRIRDGHSKLEVLWQLRRSKEGERHDPGIAGLDRALKRAAHGRDRFIGWIIRPFSGAEADDRETRRWRSLKNSVDYLRVSQDRQFALLHSLLNSAPAAAAGVSVRPAAQPTAPLSERARDIFAAMANVR